jgi:hypothetical protein
MWDTHACMQSRMQSRTHVPDEVLVLLAHGLPRALGEQRVRCDDRAELTRAWCLLVCVGA